MRFAHIAPSLLTLLMLSCSAFADVVVYTSTAITEEMLFADDPKDWAKPKVVVPPDFPPDQLVSKARGYVDADIEFDQKGNIKQVRIVKSEPQNPAFEKAVLDVTKLWLFNAVLTKDCVPVDSTGNVRTWFEVRDGKGVVSVSGNVSAASSPANSVPRKSDWENRKDFALSLKYPTNALRGRVQTDLLAAIRVDAASGVPSDVVVTWIETSGNATPTVVEEIKTAVARSLKRARFTPRAGEAYRVCVPFNFRVS